VWLQNTAFASVNDMDFTFGSSWAMYSLALCLVAAAAGISALIYVYFFYVDHARIEGIPEAPGGDLLAGHFHQLGDDHGTTAERWALKYDWPVFQMRMGRRRAVVLNSFNSAREWMVANQSATSDRPWLYTFNGVVSATSGKPAKIYLLSLNEWSNLQADSILAISGHHRYQPLG
jgi:hypothetical protein